VNLRQPKYCSKKTVMGKSDPALSQIRHVEEFIAYARSSSWCDPCPLGESVVGTEVVVHQQLIYPSAALTAKDLVLYADRVFAARIATMGTGRSLDWRLRAGCELGASPGDRFVHALVHRQAS
jgi:hypothetical protein